MKIKKGDIILAIIFLVAGIISLIYINNYKVDRGSSHINRFKIENGKVRMVWANCSNQDCIRQGTINDGSKAIICLPNKVVIEIKSKKKKFDTISQ